MIEIVNFVLLLLIGLGHNISVWWVFGLLCVKMVCGVIVGLKEM